jgi:TonB-linked SusC/RagA family outer membrane protein
MQNCRNITRRGALAVPALFFCLMSFARTGASNDFPVQQPVSDSAASKTFARISIIVKDLQDGTPVDSAVVTIGTFKGYTDRDGKIEVENVLPSLSAIISKPGYFTLTKKVKSSLQVRLAKKESNAGVATIDNGLYARPVDHFTGSATVVSGDELRKIHPLDFTQGLRYYDPSFIITDNNNYGYGPNYQPDVKIRGSYNFPASATIATSPSNSAAGYQVIPSTGDFIADNISNPNQPVFLLDGVQVSLRTAMDIDINRIGKVTILKDAAATAAYGVRGGTGVVLIETRKPQKGSLTVNYTAQVQISKADLSSYNLLDASSKLQLEKTAGMYTNNPSLYQSRLAKVNEGINTNWLAIPLQTGAGTKHTLTVDGGDDDMMYGLDFSYNNMQGVMKGDKRENIAFGGYMGTRFKNFSLTNYLTYLKSSSALSPYGNFQDYAYQNNYWNPYDSVTGEMNKVLEQYVYMNDTVTFYNPAYNGVISTMNETVSARLANTTAFNWILGKGFKLNGQFGISKYSDEQDIFLPPGHTMYAGFAPADFFKRGLYNQNMSSFLSLDGKIQLNYDKKIGLHQFYASGGASAMETRSDATGIALSGFVSDKFSDLAYGNAYSNQRPTSGKIDNRLASGFASFTYSYDNRYQLEATANADASSQFSENNNIAPHWAVGGSWNLHQERFFTPNKILNQFRIRGSIGTTGNIFYQSYLDRTSFDYFTDKQYVIAGSNSGTRGIGLGAYMNGYGNANLKAPETLKENVGFDAALLDNRLMVRFDAYDQKSTNLVLPIVSPASTGFLNFSYYDNLGGIESKGLEFGVTYNIIRNTKKQIYWAVTVNGIHNQDKVTSISDYVAKLNSLSDSMSVDQTRPQQKYLVGQSPTALYTVRSLGIDPATGQEILLTADGKQTNTWNATDKVLVGDLMPKLQGSFGSTLSYKNFSGGVYFNYQVGAKYYNQTRVDKIENADLTYNVDARAASDRWQGPGDMSLYKSVSLNGMLTSPTYVSTRFVEKNDFIRCSALSLSYDLPANISGKIRAQDIKLGFIANNVFMLQSRGDEQGVQYPVSKMYSFTLSTTF